MIYDDGISNVGGRGNLQNFVGLTVLLPAPATAISKADTMIKDFERMMVPP